MRLSGLALVALVACSGDDDKDDGTDSGAVDSSTAESFAAAFGDAACDAMVDCNADPEIIDAACDPPEPATPIDYDDCDFDVDYAEDCLAGEWTCSEVAGIAFAEPPSVCALALECPTPIDTGTTGTTGTTGDDDDDDDVTVPAPNVFDDNTLDAGIQCFGSYVDFAFDFLGEASSGMIDAADSANVSNWNDYHTLLASGITADGGYTRLIAPGITTGVSPIDWSEGVSTVFPCGFYDDPAVMSYVVRAYDLNGELADCVAWGDDPDGMIDGVYFNINIPVDESEIFGCRTATAAR